MGWHEEGALAGGAIHGRADHVAGGGNALAAMRAGKFENETDGGRWGQERRLAVEISADLNGGHQGGEATR